MQFSTKHLQLGFDLIDKEILIDNKIKKISDYSFIHLGQCVHVDIIKEFLTEKNVVFYGLEGITPDVTIMKTEDGFYENVALAGFGFEVKPDPVRALLAYVQTNKN